LHGTAAILLFFVGAFGARAAFDARFPREFEGVLGAKLEHLAANRGAHDVLVIGSSRVYRGIDPGVVDQTLAATGKESSTFNMGVQNLHGLETRWLWDRLLAIDPDFSLVVIDPERVDPQLTANVHSPRTIAWHTPALTARALWALIESPSGQMGSKTDLIDRLRWAYNHLDAFLINATRGGVLASSSPEVAPRKLGTHGDGYYPLELALADSRRPENLEQRRAGFLAGPDRFDAQIEQLAQLAADRGTAELKPHERDFLSSLMRSAADAGITVVFLQMPGPRASNWLHAALNEGVIEDLIDFSSPLEHPDIYDPDLWFDFNHLNTEGAALLSEKLGAELNAILE
jgi:hypothetical protein